MALENNKIWKIINSNVFLWMLGTIVLTYFPFIWNESKKAAEKRDRIEKIDNEMAGRLNQMFVLFTRGMDSSVYYLNSSSASDSIEAKLILYEFKESPGRSYTPKFYSSYKEFEDYPTISLLNELIALENKKIQKDSLKYILSIIVSNKLIPFAPKIDLVTAAKKVEQLKDSLVLSRWQK